MKIIFSTLLLFMSVSAFGQQTLKKAPDHYSDNFRAELQSKLGLSYEKANNVLTIISSSNNKMTSIAKASIDKTQKQKQFTAVAAERDAKLAQVLTTSQIQQLRAFMIKHREQAMSKRK